MTPSAAYKKQSVESQFICTEALVSLETDKAIPHTHIGITVPSKRYMYDSTSKECLAAIPVSLKFTRFPYKDLLNTFQYVHRQEPA